MACVSKVTDRNVILKWQQIAPMQTRFERGPVVHNLIFAILSPQFQHHTLPGKSVEFLCAPWLSRMHHRARYAKLRSTISETIRPSNLLVRTPLLTVSLTHSFTLSGRKGSNIVLAEMGHDVRALGAPAQKELIKTLDNWKLASRKSQVQELFEDRGHFFLIGAACHAELASKEHGWARLKSKVKPYVNGKLSTLQDLIATVLPQIGQRERLLDNARTRRVMHAYRLIAEKGETATADQLKLYERKHSKHRDVHVGELAALATEADMEVTKREEQILKKMETEAAMNIERKAFWDACAAKWEHKKRKYYNACAASVESKYKAAERKQKHVDRVNQGLVHSDKNYISANKSL